MKRLSNEIRDYAWGSREALARLSGREVPSPGPEAELWLGAHPSAPSRADGSPLTALLDAEPSLLGPAVRERFGPRLPYLLKLLAAAEPLSIQAHPDAAQARMLFEAGDPNYVDPFAKPELLVALEPFEALCGFRPPADSAAHLGSLPGLAPAAGALGAGDLGGAVSLLLAAPASLVSAVAAADPFVARLAALYPGDPGCLVALLLNHVTLAPDEAVFMPAGNLHAYLGGFGVEIMGASDNVLRGGLTPKRVDVPALLHVLRFEPLVAPVLAPERLGPGLLTWPVPVPEFRLVKATAPAILPADGPRIVVCVSGSAVLGDGTRLAPGESVFVGAAEPAVELTGTGVVFQASPGQLP